METPNSIAELRSRIQAAPEMVVEHIRLAERLELGGQDEDALDIWTRAQVLLPNSPVINEGLRRVRSRLAETGWSRPEPERTQPTEGVPPVGDLEGEKRRREDSEEEDSLDALISGLEAGTGRLTKTDEPEEDESEPLEDGAVEDDEEVVTETLARILVAQNKLKEAARMYEALAARESDPDQAETYRARARELNTRSGGRD